MNDSLQDQNIMDDPVADGTISTTNGIQETFKSILANDYNQNRLHPQDRHYSDDIGSKLRYLRGLKGGSGGGGGGGGRGSSGSGGSSTCYSCSNNNNSSYNSNGSGTTTLIIIASIFGTLMLLFVCCAVGRKARGEDDNEKRDDATTKLKYMFDSGIKELRRMNESEAFLIKKNTKEMGVPKSGIYLAEYSDRGNVRGSEVYLTFTEVDGRYQITGKSIDIDGQTVIDEGYVCYNGAVAYWKETYTTGDVGMQVANYGTFNFLNHSMTNGEWTADVGVEGWFNSFKFSRPFSEHEPPPEAAPPGEHVTTAVSSLASTLPTTRPIDSKMLANIQNVPGGIYKTTTTSTTTTKPVNGKTSMFDQMMGKV